MNRRNFLSNITVGAIAFLGLSKFVNAEEKKKKKADTAAGGLCDPSKGKAKEIKYFHDHKDVKDASLKTEKMGVKFEQQFCENCVLYKADTKTCMLMVGETCTVELKGWCQSWAKKPV